MSITAEVCGVVKNLKFPVGNEPSRFSIHCISIDKTYQAVCEFYCPLRNGDIINGLCLFHDNVLYFKSSPFVQPPIDRDSLVQCMISITKKGFRPAVTLYSKISNAAKGDENVAEYLTVMSQGYIDGNKENAFVIPEIDCDEMIKIFRWWHKNRNLRRLHLLGLTNKEINACHLTCERIYQKCMDNPYTLTPISLEKCDGIISRAGKVVDKVERHRGTLARSIYDAIVTKSWTATPSRMLLALDPKVADHMDALREHYSVVTDMSCCYLKFTHDIESFVYHFMVKMRREDLIEYDTPLDTPGKHGYVRKSAHFDIDVSDEQRIAIEGALDHSVSIISASAGTGKTTCLGQIVHNLELRAINYCVCSFTGKAVARIRQVTKRKDAATIHRLIANVASCKDDSDYRPHFDHIIIDEASMVTTELFRDLMVAYPNVKNVTLIGDVNQLCPISWGSLFYEVISSKTIPNYRLTKNFRVYNVVGEVDGVLLNANALLSHDPEYPFEYINTDNFTLIEGPVDRVFDIIAACHKIHVKSCDLVVLCAYNKHIQQINTQYQSIYNSDGRSVKDSRGVEWRVEDIVMLTANDQNIGVFNGESGIIADINEKAIIVNFVSSGCHEFLLEPKLRKSTYDDDSHLDQTVLRLVHAYALTIDKSQGSEWDFVILYIPETGFGSFINRNRVYTALTRAKRCVWVVVDSIARFESASVLDPPYRCENLGKKLAKELPRLEIHSSKSEVQPAEGYSESVDQGFDPDDY